MGDRELFVEAVQKAKLRLRSAFDCNLPRNQLEKAYREWMSAEFNLEEFDANTQEATR